MSNKFSSPILMENGPDPAPPSAGTLALYAKAIAGRLILKFLGPSGLDSPVQGALWANMLTGWFPGAATAISVLGGTLTASGTVSHPALAATSLRTRSRRALVTGAASAGTMVFLRPNGVASCSRETGFFLVWRGGLASLTSDSRFFVGLVDNPSTAPVNVDPLVSITRDRVGIAFNSSTGNFNVVHSEGAVALTAIDLGSSFAVDVTSMWELIVASAPNANKVSYRVKNLTTGVEVSGDITTNLPPMSSFLGMQVWLTNNATASAVAFDLSRMVIETDF